MIMICFFQLRVAHVKSGWCMILCANGGVSVGVGFLSRFVARVCAVSQGVHADLVGTPVVVSCRYESVKLDAELI